MKNKDIYDIISGAIAVIYIIFAISTISFVVSQKELEFNRIWRTRVFLVAMSLLFQVFSCITNIFYFVHQISSETGINFLCSATSWVQSGFFLPLLLFSAANVVRTATTVELLQSDNPNRSVISRSFLFSILPIIVCIAPVIVTYFDTDLPAFQTYYQDRCIVPTINAGIDIIVELVAILLLCKANDSFNRASLNIVHARRIKAFPFCVFPFILQSAAEIVLAYIDTDIVITILKFVAIGMNFLGSVLLIFLLVIRPIREAKEFPILRGSLTKRHGLLETVSDGPSPIAEL